MAAVTAAVDELVAAVVPLDRLDPDPDNVRRVDADDDGMVVSVRSRGILEPLLVSPDGDRYVIVCGHRRYRAAVTARLGVVPCVVRPMTPQARHAASLPPPRPRPRRSRCLTRRPDAERLGPDAMPRLWAAHNRKEADRG